MTYRRFVEGNNAAGWVAPLPWDAALKLGHYNPDEKGDLTPDELYTVCTRNPAKVVGLKLN